MRATIKQGIALACTALMVMVTITVGHSSTGLCTHGNSLSALPSSSSFTNSESTTIFSHFFLATDSSQVDRLVALSHQYIGAPYRYGGKGPSAFDCAGYTRFLFRHFDIELPSAAAPQYKKGKPIKKTADLRRGDLVFFGDKHHPSRIGHVGMVVENDMEHNRFLFIHASTSAGVIISKSTEPYYKRLYLCACRVMDDSCWVAPPPTADNADTNANNQTNNLADTIDNPPQQESTTLQDSTATQHEPTQTIIE